MSRKETVAVLGASLKPERYSNKAIKLLMDYGHDVIPVNPSRPVIHGLQAVANLADIRKDVNTLTMYVQPALSSKMADDVIALKPDRVIFNPGTENPELAEKCRESGIDVEEACTLVLLNTGQF